MPGGDGRVAAQAARPKIRPLMESPPRDGSLVGNLHGCMPPDGPGASGLQQPRGAQTGKPTLIIRPELRQEHPLNLSISISGGKETNQDSPSSGERTGKSPT